MAVDFKSIMRELANKNYQPIYFLSGDEPYYIDKITQYIETSVLSEADKAFNQTVIYGNETDASNIDTTARRFPMMASHQVVVVKEAQNIKDIENLVYYVDNPQKSTILVINYKYKSLDKRKKLYKSLQKNAVLYESKKIYDDRIPNWIDEFVKSRKLSIKPEACMLLNEFLGNDLLKIEKEIEKLMVSMPEGMNEISPELIERNIGISKDYNNFELTKALARKNIIKANRIINYFGNNQKTYPVFLTITTLYYFFSKTLAIYKLKDKSPKGIASGLKINPFFAADYLTAYKNYPSKKLIEIFSILREFDLKSKGRYNNSTPPDQLLKEMIFKIMH